MDTLTGPIGIDDRLRYRGRTVLVSGASYLVDVLLLVGFAAAGTISHAIVAYFATGATAATLIFYAALRSGFSARFRDPHLAMLQAIMAGVITIGVMYLAPQLTFYFLAVLFVIFAWATLRIGRLEALLCWLLLCVGTSWVMLLNEQRLALPDGRTELAILWLAYVLAVGRCNLIAWYGSSLRARLRLRNTQLAESVARVAQLAHYDTLTGVLNRGSLLKLLDKELLSKGGALCLALLDLDHFKEVNDRYGHLVGDRVLERFASQARLFVRDGDLIGRYGGEEFVIVFRNTDCDEAHAGVERIRSAIAVLDWSDLAPGIRLTVSAGFTEYRDGESAIELLRRADTAMYAAKHQGRNRSLRFDVSHDAALAQPVG